MSIPARVVAALALAAGAVSSANAAIIFRDDFEAGYLTYHWTGHRVLSEDAPIFTHFNGHHLNHEAILGIKQPPIPPPGSPPEGDGGTGGGGGDPRFIRYSLKFDLYMFDSWDGNGSGGEPADRIRVDANGLVIFDETFSNRLPTYTQSFREPDMARSNMGGYASALDAIYRNIVVEFSVPWTNDLSIRWKYFGGGGGFGDESWGLDNVEIGYTIVPAPGAAALLGAAGLCVVRRRRGA